MSTAEQRAAAVLEHGGSTLAQRAGIRSADRPAALWQILVLANLVSAPISADIAVAAARELFAAGATTAADTEQMSWQERVDALGREGYVRYDESTATRLGDCARKALDDVRGDLRRLPAAADQDRAGLVRALREYPGIGPTGVEIFCREVQHVWPWLRPYADRATVAGAERLSLPTDPHEMAALVAEEEIAVFFAGLAQAGRDGRLAERVASAASAG